MLIYFLPPILYALAPTPAPKVYSLPLSSPPQSTKKKKKEKKETVMG